MFMVVMGHTIYFCMYHETTFHDDIFNLICTFHVPLFFFLSGFVINTPPNIAKFITKACRFLTPMLIIGTINALLIYRLKDFFLNGGHNGYWYLLTLTIFYMMMMIFNINKSNNKYKSFVFDIIIAFCIWLIFYFLLHIPNIIIDALNPWGAYAFWPFFIIGYFCRKYKIIDYFTKSIIPTILCIVTYLIIVFILFDQLKHLSVYMDFCIALVAIAALIGIVIKFEQSNSWLDRQLLFIGTHTLDIYIYHYFFIRFINLDFLITKNTFIELFIITLLTIAIVYGSLALRFIIYHSIKKMNITNLFDKLKKSLCLLMVFIPISSIADGYDENNYRPGNTDVHINVTNLPIVFINTQQQVIHKDYRISARMKIINNKDGINYGDTLAFPSQTVDYDGWIAIRYRGNTSFNWSPKKPYNFKTMLTNDPEGKKLKTKLLGMPKDNSWVLLSSYGDRSLLRDVLVFQLARPYFDYTPRCRYCEMVLDGVYYGVFILTENIRKSENRLNLDDPGDSGDALTGGYQLQIDRDDEEHYISKYLAIDSLGRTYSAYNKIFFQYKHPEYDELLPVQKDYIHNQIDLMEDVLASEDFTNPETGYRKYIDELSFIDQQLSQEFSGNIDGYRLSTNIYKKRDSIDPRFKTALWDFNLAFGNSNAANAIGTDFWRYENSYLTNYNAYNKVPFWWMRLMEDPEYVKQLKNRWSQYRKELYSDEHIEAVIDSITTLLNEKEALQRNNTVWNMFNNSTYEMEITKLKQWIKKRVIWMDEQLGYNDKDTNSNIKIIGEFNKQVIGYYNLFGKKINNTTHNQLFIIRYQDGSTKKIIRTYTK